MKQTKTGMKRVDEDVVPYNLLHKQIKMGLKWDAEDVVPYDLLHKINKTGEKMCGRGTDTLN